MLDADEITPGQPLGYPLNFGVSRFKLAMWKVGGIEIERTRAPYPPPIFLRADKEFSENGNTSPFGPLAGMYSFICIVCLQA